MRKKPSFIVILVSVLVVVSLFSWLSPYPAAGSGGLSAAAYGLEEDSDETTQPEYDSPWLYANQSIAASLDTGPDHYGYTVAEVPAVAINGLTGTPLFDKKPDQRQPVKGIGDPVPLGFSFSFYENSYDKVYITTSGMLTFESGSLDSFNFPPPLDISPNNFVAAFWDDLGISTAATSNIYYKTEGTAPNRRFVVQWNEMIRFGDAETDTNLYTFQAILYEKDGSIRLQYITLEGIKDEATVGIEDAEGLDGLTYLHNTSTYPATNALLFTRPAASRRAKFLGNYESKYAIQGSALIPVYLRNSGSLGADSYQLSLQDAVAPGWQIQILKGDGFTPAGNTGLIAQGEAVKILLSVKAPTGASAGSHVKNTLKAVSVNAPTLPAAIDTVDFQVAMPAPFAAGYADNSPDIGGIMLGLNWGPGTITNKVAPWTGSTLAMNNLADGGYIYAWEINGTNNSGDLFTNIEYYFLSNSGMPTIPLSKLTDNYSSGQGRYIIMDRFPSLAGAPNGKTGAVWKHSQVDKELDEDSILSNIYFSILSANGTIQTRSVNITGNTSYGSGSNPSVPDYFSPRIAATQDNRFVLMWTDTRPTVSDVYYAIYNHDGSRVKAPTKLTNSAVTGLLYSSPTLEALPGNRFLFAFSATPVGLEAYTIQYGVLDSTGATVVKAITELAGAVGYELDVVQLQSGNIILVWTSTNDPGSIGYAVLNGSTYNQSGSPAILHNPNKRDAGNVSVTQDANSAILTWVDTLSEQYLYYAVVDNSGGLVTPAMIFYKSSKQVITNPYGQGNATYNGIWRNFLPGLLKK